jgi:NADP-dependent 3-hydroxy acid dehydrogenase YdfG
MGGKVVDPAEVVKTALFMYQMPQEISVREVVIATTKQDL